MYIIESPLTRRFAMITNRQVRKLRQLDRQGLPKEVAALRVGMDAKSARKYRRLGKLPSEVMIMDRKWRTHPDLFAEVWPELEAKLQLHPGLQAKTLFADLQRRFPGRFADGQLRTLQRRVKTWRAEGGPAKEVFFAQVHHPGRLAASDFTHCTDLGVTINGSPFAHMIYHFVLTYSNWETGTICFSESLESLSEGLQNALWELDGVPQMHRTDRLTAAVQPGVEGRESFKRRYQALLSHYGLHGQAIQAGKGNENGDAEQSHHQFKRALDQALMMRGSRDFTSRASYWEFVRQVFAQQNAGRAARLAEEVALLRPLPSHRLEACKRLRVRVERGSIIKVQGNIYTVASQLIGEKVEARLYAERVEVWYAQKRVEQLPRLRGRGKHHVEYRHVIDWLVRKPGAFADYRYREEMFPSSHFRMAYDVLHERQPARADKEYLRILHLAARESEAGVEAVLVELLQEDGRMDAAAVAEKLRQRGQVQPVTAVTVAAVDLGSYDALLDGKEAEDGEGREGEAGSVSEGTAPAGVPGQLRGSGAAGTAGGTELRAVPAGAGGAGVPGAAEQTGRTPAARVTAAAGEELASFGPEAAAGQGGAAGADTAGGVVPGSL
jgi:Mu transposase, C-terminal domain